MKPEHLQLLLTREMPFGKHELKGSASHWFFQYPNAGIRSKSDGAINLELVITVARTDSPFSKLSQPDKANFSYQVIL